MAEKDIASKVMMAHADALFRHENVHGLDIQHRHLKTKEIHLGAESGADLEPVIIIHVDPDPATGLPLGVGLPDELEGIPCVLEASERPHTCVADFHKRPLQAGLQISRVGWKNEHFGTMTCFVSERGNKLLADVNPPLVLSAAHVINPALAFPDTMVDEWIYQPQSTLGINKCAWAGKALYGGKDHSGIDAGYATVEPGVDFANYCWTIGYITGVAKATVGMIVSKHGRTTGKTFGKIVSDRYVSKAIGGYMLKIQATDAKGAANNSSFAEKGDSGAPVMHGGDLVGILHAKMGRDLAAVTMADGAMAALNVELYKPR